MPAHVRPMPRWVAPDPSGSRAAGIVLAVVLGIGLVVGALLVAMLRPSPQTETTTTWITVPIQQRPVISNPAPVQAAPRVAPIGNWTPERGRLIAQRALAWLSWPYSFGAGNAQGPTYGFAVDEDSRNDGKVLGFDCSGLVIHALAPWLNVDHSASAQYTEAGTFHPALDSLQPGDLIFWSPDGTVAGIGHVAVYIGDGKVVQAPRSGARIVVTPIGSVEPGAIGVTRPLT